MNRQTYLALFMGAASLFGSQPARAQSRLSAPSGIVLQAAQTRAQPQITTDPDGTVHFPYSGDGFTINRAFGTDGSYREVTRFTKTNPRTITVQGTIHPTANPRVFEASIQSVQIRDAAGVSHDGLPADYQNAKLSAEGGVRYVQQNGKTPWIQNPQGAAQSQQNTQPQQTSPNPSTEKVQWQGDNATVTFADGRKVTFVDDVQLGRAIIVKDPKDGIQTAVDYYGRRRLNRIYVDNINAGRPIGTIIYFGADSGKYQIRGRVQPVTPKEDPKDDFFPVPEDLKQRIQPAMQTIVQAKQDVLDDHRAQVTGWGPEMYPGVEELSGPPPGPAEPNGAPPPAVSPPPAQNPGARLAPKNSPDNGEMTYFDAAANRTNGSAGWIINISQDKNSFYATDLANNVRYTTSYYVNRTTGERGLSAISGSNGHKWNPRSSQTISPDLKQALDKVEEAQQYMNGQLLPAYPGNKRQATPQQQPRQ